MTQLEITLDSALIQGLLIDNDRGMAQLMSSVLNQVLQSKVAAHLGAQPYEQTDERQGYRNGYRSRTLLTRVGPLELKVPRVRNGDFSHELFERYQRAEQALVISLVEMVVQGVSTRKVSAIVEELCGEATVSKSFVSSLCSRLDPIVAAWRERPLDGDWPFVVVDALVIRVREDGRVRQKSALVATGINAEGYREILGLCIGDGESEQSWGAFFGSLKERGLRGVDVVVSDSHSGLVKALHSQFAGASWQRCQTHFSRNILSAVAKSDQGAFHRRLRHLFEAADATEARKILGEVIAEFGSKAKAAVACLEAGFDDAIAVLDLPEPYRKRLRTTNSQERLNEEIRRREKVIRIFPNQASAMRLMGAILMEHHENWSCGKKYFDMTAYWQWARAGRKDPVQGACMRNVTIEQE